MEELVTFVAVSLMLGQNIDRITVLDKILESYVYNQERYLIIHSMNSKPTTPSI
jgi:hypothetical protein